MSKNFEVKLGPVDLADVQQRAARFADSGPFELQQADHFFKANSGRLKLRIQSCDKEAETAELIAYDRADDAKARISDYVRCPSQHPQLLLECLQRSLGRELVVTKRRQLFLSDRSRIHLDQVEGLGDFVEIEVVLDETASGNDPDGQQEMADLVTKLGLDQVPVVPVAYADLLRAAR